MFPIVDLIVSGGSAVAEV